MSGFQGRRGQGQGQGQGQGGAWRGASSAPKGTFSNGVWHCDCNPPLPAVHFQVRKEGPNKGRWFRTCQRPQEERCKFYLWDSDAHGRENAALVNNSRTEPAHTAATTPRTQRVASPPPPYTVQAGPAGSSRKRQRSAVQQEEDEYGFGTPDEDFEEQLSQVLVRVETPSKKPRTETSAFVTPSRSARRKLPWQTDNTSLPSPLPTPHTDYRTPRLSTTHPATPESSLLTPSRYRPSEDSLNEIAAPSPNGTPTPARFKDVSESNLARDVFDMLRDVNVQLDEQGRANLAAVLSRYATIAEGVKRGREVARASAAAKTAKVTELTYRVSTLEAELEAEKAKVGHLQWSLEHGQQSG